MTGHSAEPLSARDAPRPGFLADERGGAVEFMILLPAHLLVLGFTFMVGMTLIGIGQAWDVARDVARRAAIGELTDSAAVEMVEARLSGSLQPHAVIDPDPEEVRLSITILPDFRVLTFMNTILPDGYTMTYVMRRETEAPEP